MLTVSVIIPCYNRADLVGETIQNILDQSYKPHEIIVVDDGSTDNSVEVIRSFGASITLIQQPNQGPGAARNAGFKASTGDLIQFMDSDDLASKNKLEVQVHALQSPGADFAYCPWVRCTISNKSIRFLDKILQAGAVPDKKPMLEYFLSGWSLVFQNCLFKRTILQTSGIYRTDLMPSEDSEYFIRILLAGARPVHTPECLVFYREHNSNKITASGTSVKHRATDWTHFLKITGHQVAGRLSKMKLSTKVALSASVKMHTKQCAQLQLPQLPADHPYLQFSVPFLNLLCSSYILNSKIQRRLSKSPDYYPAFSHANGGPAYQKLVNEIGYKNLNNE